MSNSFITIIPGRCQLALALAVLLIASNCAGQPGYAPNRAAYADNSSGRAPATQGPALTPMTDSQVRPANAVTPPQVLSDFTRSAATPIQPSPSAHDNPGTVIQPQSTAHAALPQEGLRPRSASREPALPLPARGAAPKGSASPTGPLLTTGVSLAAVLAMFLGLAWLMRRGMPGAQLLLPSEVVESLGRAPLAGRQQMQLIRCGNKLLLVCISSVGAETLTEITDPLEIDRLCGLCRQAHPQSATKAFRQVLEQLGNKQTAPGFAGDSRVEAMQLATRRPEHRYGGAEDDDV